MKTLATILSAAFALTVHQNAEAACGTVEVSKGDVKIQSGQTKKTEPAAVGGKICSGDTIIAAKDSRAKLKMEDGNELNVSPDSKIVLESYEYKPSENRKKVLLNVLQGKVRAATKEENMYNDKSKDGQANTFQVRTKSAVAGVRGTDFMTGYNPSTNTSEIITFKGRVEVGQPGPGGQIMNAVSVTAGHKTEANLGKPPEAPRPIPPRELQQLNSETRTEAPASNVAPSASTGSGGDKEAKDGSGPKDQPQSNGQANGQANGQGNGQANGQQPGAGNRGEGEKSPSNEGGRSSAGGPRPGAPGPAAGAGGSGGSGSGMAGSEGSSSGGMMSGPQGPAPAPGMAPRAPGSITGGSMLNDKDLGGAAGLPTVSAPTLPGGIPMPPVVDYRPPTALPPIPVCQQCIDAIQNSPTRLNITVQY